MPELGAGKLTAERRGMRAWRRSMMQALAARPVSEAPNIVAQAPDAASLLDGLVAVAAGLPRSHLLAGILFDVVEYERMHPDIDAVTLFLGVDGAWIDGLFRHAARIGGGQ